MRQTDVHEKIVEPMTAGMNLADVKIYTDNSGEVQEVLLKYTAPSHGPELLSGGVYYGKTPIDGDGRA